MENTKENIQIRKSKQELIPYRNLPLRGLLTLNASPGQRHRRHSDVTLIRHVTICREGKYLTFLKMELFFNDYIPHSCLTRLRQVYFFHDFGDVTVMSVSLSRTGD